MKFVRTLLRSLNIFIFSLLFLMASVYSLSPSVSENSGIMSYLNLSNLLYYSGYVLFGMALVQYIRNKNIDWHNFYLVFVLSVFCWILIALIIFSPYMDQIFSDDANPQIFYVELFDFFADFMAEVENSESPPEKFYGYLLNFIVTYNICMIIGIFLAIPLAFYGLFLLIKKYIPEGGRYKWNVIMGFVILILAFFLFYDTVFGEMTTSSFATFKERVNYAWEDEISFAKKLENIEYAKPHVKEFISSLNWNIFNIGLLMLVVFLLILSITNKNINSIKAKTLKDEFN